MTFGGLGSGPRGPELIRLPVSGFVFQDYGDPTIKTVAEAGFKMIFSNYDATYLDFGFIRNMPTNHLAAI